MGPVSSTGAASRLSASIMAATRWSAASSQWRSQS
jgi:hypothetical protein